MITNENIAQHLCILGTNAVLAIITELNRSLVGKKLSRGTNTGTGTGTSTAAGTGNSV